VFILVGWWGLTSLITYLGNLPTGCGVPDCGTSRATRSLGVCRRMAISILSALFLFLLLALSPSLSSHSLACLLQVTVPTFLSCD
jgi:hypothetical protein